MPRTYYCTMHTAPKLWYKIVVYESLAEMQAATRRYRPNELHTDDFVGCFQLAEGPSKSFMGIMRLCDEHLDRFVIIHEAVHVAVAYVGRTRGKTLVIDPYAKNTEREEDLAYAVHSIADSLLEALEAK